MENKINNPIYYPMLASEEVNGGALSDEEFRSVWNGFQALPQERQDILTSEEMPFRIKELQTSLELGDDVVESLSVLIRWYFFDFLKDAALVDAVRSILPPDGVSKTDKIIEKLKTDIFSIKPKKTLPVPQVLQAKTASVEQIPLMQAITKYERLSQQLITEDKILVRSQPVRPSLVNWIKCYRDELGVGFHDSVQRGNFLFRSENGKRLTTGERERVNLILKSIEENYPLSIDTEHFEIVFPKSSVAMPRPEHHEPSAIAAKYPVVKGPEFGTRQEIPKPVQQTVPVSAPPKAAAFVPKIAQDRPVSVSPYRTGNAGIDFSNQKTSEIPDKSLVDDSQLSFSLNHVFPAEHEAMNHPQSTPAQAPVISKPAVEPVRSMPTTTPPVAPKPAPKKMNPFIINPISHEE